MWQRISVALAVLAFVCPPRALSGQEGLPRYCDTEAGVLGPYDNPGNVRVGDPCFGTKDGRRYDGTAVMGRSRPTPRPERLPRYCDTEAGVLGPYPNSGDVQVGDPCFGMKDGQRYEGTAVTSRRDARARESSSGRPRYCDTEVGVLGPYRNDGSVRVGDPCYGTRDGRRYEGVAVMSP